MDIWVYIAIYVSELCPHNLWGDSWGLSPLNVQAHPHKYSIGMVAKFKKQLFASSILLILWSCQYLNI